MAQTIIASCCTLFEAEICTDAAAADAGGQRKMEISGSSETKTERKRESVCAIGVAKREREAIKQLAS